jgi:hypothetical protein
MTKPKFSIGQKVLVAMYHSSWIDDYEMPATIVRQDDVYFNGTPTYIVKRGEETYVEVSENRIRLDVDGSGK